MTIACIALWPPCFDGQLNELGVNAWSTTAHHGDRDLRNDMSSEPCATETPASNGKLAERDVFSAASRVSHCFEYEEIGTRDGEPSITIRLARFVGAKLVPLAGLSDGASLGWALSEVAVRVSWLARHLRKEGPAASLAAAMAHLRASWPEFEQSMPVIVVRADDTAAGDLYADAGRSPLQ